MSRGILSGSVARADAVGRVVSPMFPTPQGVSFGWRPFSYPLMRKRDSASDYLAAILTALQYAKLQKKQT